MAAHCFWRGQNCNKNNQNAISVLSRRIFFVKVPVYKCLKNIGGIFATLISLQQVPFLWGHPVLYTTTTRKSSITTTEIPSWL